jgi:hypothetical protein
VPVALGAVVREDSVFVIALLGKVERSLAGAWPVRVIDNDDGILGEEGLGNL